MATLILTTASVFLVALFLSIYLVVRKELPDSISAVVYELPKGNEWMWSTWLAAVSLCLFVPLVETCGWLGWLTEVCLFGAALTPLVNKDTTKWHYRLAIAAGVLSQVCVAWLCADWLSAWMAFLFLWLSSYVQPDGWLGKEMKGKGVMIAEVVCYVSMIGSLLTI